MNLFDRLKALSNALPPSHIATPGELAGFVSALCHYIEHGEELLDAAVNGTMDDTKNMSAVDAILSPDSAPRDTVNVQPMSGQASPATQIDIAELARQLQALTSATAAVPVPGVPSVAPAAFVPDAPGAAADLARRDAEIATLKQQLAAATAANTETTVSVTPMEDGPDTPVVVGDLDPDKKD